MAESLASDVAIGRLIQKLRGSRSTSALKAGLVNDAEETKSTTDPGARDTTA